MDSLLYRLFGFFQLGELLPASPASLNTTTDLSWGDVAVNDRSNPQMIQIYLKRSKCNQFGQGADVVVGVTGTEICPVTALTQFMVGRGSAQGPFFHDADGGTLTKPVFIRRLRDVLQSLGIPACQYAGHT